MKVRFVCDTCGKIMKMNEKEWLEHLKERHPKKVNCKNSNIKGRVYYQKED